MRYTIVIINQYIPRKYAERWIQDNNITEEGNRVTRIIRQWSDWYMYSLRGIRITDADIYYLHTTPETCSTTEVELATRIREGGDIKIHIIKEEFKR